MSAITRDYPVFAVTVNTPGYLPPMQDEMECYDNLGDAASAFAGAVDALLDDGYEMLYCHADYARLCRPDADDDAGDLGLEVELSSFTMVA